MGTTLAQPSLTTPRPISLGAQFHSLARAERGRLFLFLPVAAGAGILLYFSLRTEPALWLGPAAASLSAFALAALWRFRPLRIPLALLLASTLGFSRAQLQTTLMPPLMIVPHHAVTLTGRISEIDLLANGRRVLIAHPSLNGGPAEARSVRVKLRPTDSTALHDGAKIRLRALLYGPSRTAYPGGWNFGRNQFFADIGAVGFALSPATIIDQTPPDWRDHVRSLREAIAARILARLPLSTGSIAVTLLTGFEQSIPPAERQDFVTAGLAHLLAVAGLHIGIVMATLYALARFLAGLSETLLLRIPAKFIASSAAFLGGCAYAALTGFHIPILRSLAMAALVLLGILIGRRALSLRGLAIAAMALMLLNPSAVVGPSFQMSFSAVLALIAGYEAIGHRLHARRERLPARLGRHIAALAFTSFLAGGASMPFAAYHFQQIQPYYILANLIAVPLTAILILPLGLLALLLMPFHAARLALIPMGWGIHLILKLAHAVGTLPHALILVPPFSGAAVALIALGLASLGLLRTRARFTGLAPIALGLLLAAHTSAPTALISSRANLTALRTRHGIVVLVAGRRDKFLLHQWRPLWPGQNFHIRAAAHNCPDGRCWADHGAILFLLNRAAAASGCFHAKIIISPRPLHGACRGAGRIVIDRFAPWREGAIAIRHASTHPTILTDRTIEGTRPWVPPWPAW
ncbi:MAG TPA: ComEC/Rec2 family competence protein [Acidiphilium sp.]|nr:MAG: competence protein [Acidiphilium sp. 21-60-14]OYV89411.1 MAG: competence protein [Acidiphilium sp. 37-60-79]HQT89587.1 ComEC/Rec2 family competence protein [Acidiphilium sp.]HQU24956.1 ComEC/Rec2 family competence protein [Acidiphilium sp.]